MSEPAQSADAKTGPAAAEDAGYRVLARKYRPASFADLIGQDAMVRTISNAFELGRIPQAWILTGVRGVGKTTTARILARALNYELPDGSVTEPTVNMPVMGVHCQAIIESRHIDVLEMDAASHNSVEDVRQINDAIRYAPVSARYKVYILDEVHMLSGAAFNALLKTLEEPPPHAKFIFATTEIRKVPVTVLSRCQRFDLRRVDAALLGQASGGHRDERADRGGAGRAGADSARGGRLGARQSLAARPGYCACRRRNRRRRTKNAGRQGSGRGRAADARARRPRAHRRSVRGADEGRYRSGARMNCARNTISAPIRRWCCRDLAEFTHFVTRVKVVPSVADDVSLSEAERVRGRAFAAQLSMRVLSRAWQMLLKGVSEVQASGRPVAAAEMVLVRIAYAADLPTPDEVVRSLSEEGGAPARPQGNGGASAAPSQSYAPRYDAPRGSPRSSAAAAPRPADDPVAQADTAEVAPTLAISSFEQLIALAAEKRDIPVKMTLERDVRLVRCEDGQLEIALEPSAPKTFVHDLQRKLTAWTGKRWIVVVSQEQGAPTVRAQSDARQAEIERGVEADPLVQAVLNRFPGAKIVGVTQNAPEAGEADDMPRRSERRGISRWPISWA